MPARNRRNLNPDAPPETLAPRQAVADPDALSETVERILGELGESADTVTIYREDDTRVGKRNFIARVPATEFSAAFVADQYGGGDYQIVITDKVQGPLEPVFLSVDRRIIGKAWAVNQGAAGITAPNSDSTLRDRLLELFIARMMTTPQPVAAPTNSAQETLQIIAALAPLIRGGGDGGNSVEMFAAMMSAATEMARMANPPEGFAAVASNMVPLIEKLVAAQTAMRVPPRRIPAVPPSTTVNERAAVAVPVDGGTAVPAPVVETPSPSPVAGTIVPKWLAPFRVFAGMLVGLADDEADPAVYANVCLDQLIKNEDAFKSAVEAMNAGTLKDDVLNAVPAMKETEARRAFVEKLVNEVEEGLKDVLSQQEEGVSNG